MTEIKTINLLELGHIDENKTFKFPEDDIERSLADFIKQYPYVVLHQGVWATGEKVKPNYAIQVANKSGWGATVKLAYNNEWMDGEVNGKSEIHFYIPSASEML